MYVSQVTRWWPRPIGHMYSYTPSVTHAVTRVFVFKQVVAQHTSGVSRYKLHMSLYTSFATLNCPSQWYSLCPNYDFIRIVDPKPNHYTIFVFRHTAIIPCVTVIEILSVKNGVWLIITTIDRLQTDEHSR